MDWIKSSELIAEAKFRLAESQLHMRKQRQIVEGLRRIGANTEHAQKFLSHLLDAQKRQKMQLKRLRTEQQARPQMEKHELSKIDFEMIDGAFKALLQSDPNPMTADKIADLRNMFRDAYPGWLEIEQEAA